MSIDQLSDDSSVAPEQVRAYLATEGWELTGEYPDTGTELWEIASEGPIREQVLLPADPRFVDYRRRLNDAIERVCEVYNWDLNRLVSALQQNRSDLLYLRADQITRFDSIPLKQAEQMLSGCVTLLQSAAWSTYSPRASLAGRKPNAVRDYVTDDLRMGHTQRGSFIITILSRIDEESIEVRNPQVPLDRMQMEEVDEGVSYPDVPYSAAEPVHRLIDDYEEEAMTEPAVERRSDSEAAQAGIAQTGNRSFFLPPFQRRVMSTLASAVDDARVLATSDSRASARIEAAVNRGVSAQLCQSLQDMTQYSGLRKLDLNFSWASLPQFGSPTLNTVSLGRDAISGLETLPGAFKRQEKEAPRQSVTISGRVIRLERPEQSDESDAAPLEVATISGVIGRRQRRQVRVLLTPAIRDQFISAFRRSQTINVTGELARNRRGYVMHGTITVSPA